MKKQGRAVVLRVGMKMSMLSIPSALTEHSRVTSTSWHCRAPVEGSSPPSKSDRVQVSVEVLSRLKIRQDGQMTL